MLLLQYLNNAYYRLEWEELSVVSKARAIRGLSAVLKIATVIFVIIAVISFADIAMTVGFAIGAAVSFITVLAFDFLAGSMLFSYVYLLSNDTIVLKKEFKNGKNKICLNCAAERISVSDICKNQIYNRFSFMPVNVIDTDVNYLELTSDGQRFQIAADDYMTAMLRRICK